MASWGQIRERTGTTDSQSSYWDTEFLKYMFTVRNISRDFILKNKTKHNFYQLWLFPGQWVCGAPHATNLEVVPLFSPAGPISWSCVFIQSIFYNVSHRLEGAVCNVWSIIQSCCSNQVVFPDMSDMSSCGAEVNASSFKLPTCLGKSLEY